MKQLIASQRGRYIKAETDSKSSQGIHLHAALIAVGALLIYIFSGTFQVPSGDVIPIGLTPFSILLHGDVFLGRYFTADALKNPPYYLVPSHGDFVTNTYYIGPSLTALPIYAVFLLLGVKATFAHALIIGKISASVISAASVYLSYVLLRRLAVRPWIAIAFTVLYAIGSETFAVSSQSMWRHGPSELWITVFLLCAVHIVSHPNRGWIAPQIAGLAMGMLFLCRAQNVILVLPFISLLWKKEYRKQVLSSIPIFLAILMAFWWFRLVYYSAPSVVTGISKASGLSKPAHIVTSVINGPLTGDLSQPKRLDGSFLQGLLGNTLSPSRGLFVFMPWTLFGFLWLGYFRKVSAQRVWYVLLTITGICYVVMYSMLPAWDAGTSYGPRYMADALPVFTSLAALSYELSQSNKRWCVWIRGICLGLFGVWSIGLQFLGADVPKGILWNTAVHPVGFPSSMWFVRDGEVSFYLQALAASQKQPVVIRDPNVSFDSVDIFTVDNKNHAVLEPGTRYNGLMVVTNTGFEPWSPYPSNTGKGIVRLTYTVHTTSGARVLVENFESIPLHVVRPGESIKLYFSFKTPYQAGNYIYTFQLSQSGNSSFWPTSDVKTRTQVPVTVS